jgi:hypothetical protein
MTGRWDRSADRLRTTATLIGGRHCHPADFEQAVSAPVTTGPMRRRVVGNGPNPFCLKSRRDYGCKASTITLRLRIAAERRLPDIKGIPDMQRQFRAGSGFIGVLVVVFGTYFLFRGPSRTSTEVPELNPSIQVGQEGCDEIAASEPAYDVASLPRIEIGQQVEFGVDQDNRALLSGWSVPEPGGIWSLGKHAAIGFVIAGVGATDNPVVLLEGMVFVAPPHPQQMIEVWLADRKLNEVTLRTTQTKFAVALERMAIIDGTPIILSLRLPNAVAPGKVTNSTDPREIAFRITSLRLEL